jgi:hypothetical protein
LRVAFEQPKSCFHSACDPTFMSCVSAFPRLNLHVYRCSTLRVVLCFWSRLLVGLKMQLAATTSSRSLPSRSLRTAYRISCGRRKRTKAEGSCHSVRPWPCEWLLPSRRILIQRIWRRRASLEDFPAPLPRRWAVSCRFWRHLVEGH